MVSRLPNSLGKDALDALLATGTVKAMLVSSDAFDKDSWTRRSHITNELATAGGYTAGGVTVTATTTTNNTNDRGECTFSTPSWASFTASARGVIFVLVKGGAASADPILAYGDFLTTQVGGGDNFTIPINVPIYLTNAA